MQEEERVIHPTAPVMGDIFSVILFYYIIALSISTEEPERPFALALASHGSAAAESPVGKVMGTYLAHSYLLCLPKLSARNWRKGEIIRIP